MTSPEHAHFPDFKDTLIRYLEAARDAVVWKLEGASEYDVRRPMTPTGTNLLGIVKHLASVEAGYFGETFGRPWPEPLPWFEDDAPVNADILRETIDSSAGVNPRYTNLPEDGYDWPAYVAKVEQAARVASGRTVEP
ncbi:DUF664 domain-containing protein [Nocardioides bigeumensis]|uniref:DUF664 domain-containing protein n=1 Tax=Nocardioides bigeumensis TaxID=433657 RepID=A0ABP5JIC0_9ACTN